ncbi:hypothetical protein [Roseicella aquatilis]|uniref:Uncharacterized protein n=1 Tax=Roseicella aquatilis TaxID=2527868 RepID=A0A4R4DCG6_9PROT|nr:hypothetical protein [Roseicella aquatilis]TCZ57808.1 hypothetical protein EXY23_17750 [Roseicella aquatilis]
MEPPIADPFGDRGPSVEFVRSLGTDTTSLFRLDGQQDGFRIELLPVRTLAVPSHGIGTQRRQGGEVHLGDLLQNAHRRGSS